MKQNDYVKACLDQLIPQLTGLTITGGVADDSGEYFGFTVKGKQNGKAVEKTVFVMADAECNGPGFLEINDGVEPEPQAYSEWCPNCSTEVAYKENQPFPCTTCGEILFPCAACYMANGNEYALCDQCPWETKGKEAMSCAK
ncbi:hypothetical protein [Pontiella sulfatireligans]|uniref:hypothetical protein n=1 Tax=Pontiella sulfatireligans TaxID=2750658 RepID=UPI00109D5F92|nr:hypothetical protein [Pontiella sulfatireligans]